MRRASGVLILLAAGGLAGCGPVRQAVAGVFGSGPSNVVDAHAVYRQRDGCATVAARTVRHGYTVLTPTEPLAVEPAGLFEGPALVGTYVFRYVPPRVGETWDGARASDSTAEARVSVAAVDLELEDVRVWLDRLCGAYQPGDGVTRDDPPGEGTPGEGTPGEAVPRIPRPS